MFTGDPPHEHQDWYGIYDTDTTTLRLLDRYARRIAAIGDAPASAGARSNNSPQNEPSGSLPNQIFHHPNPIPMNKLIISLVSSLVLLAGLGVSPTAAQDALEARVDSVLQRMTLEEKVGQMTQVTLGVVTDGQTEGAGDAPPRPTLDTEALREAIVEHNVGSLLNVADNALTPEQWHNLIGQIQDVATEETRLGIPILYGIDSVHGANYVAGSTIFPQNIGLAATFDPSLAREAGAITARETRAAHLPWNFAPVVDLGREPQWPRFYETFGEDPHLTQKMGVAAVEGMEGEDVSDGTRVASTMKHYIGYSGPTSGLDRTTAQIPERLLRSHYLPPFQAVVESGAKTIMVNSGDVNGIPVHAGEFLMTDVLRGELGFDGLVVTDWRDVLKLHDVHRTATTTREAAQQALDAGIDMCMVPHDYSFYDDVLALVEEGKVSEARIDESVRRILRLKAEVGLLESAAPPENSGRVNTEADQQANLVAARKSLTLLKNENDILPLEESAEVLVTGPAASSVGALTGGWTYTWQGNDAANISPHSQTLLDALEARGASVTHVAGATFDSLTTVDAAVNAAGDADAVLLAVGEDAYAEKPGDIRDLRLPNAQIELAEAVAETGTPIVAVVIEGRPRLMPPVFEQSDAALMAYQPGIQGARAIADVLYGDVSPSGRLPFAYPQDSNVIVPYDARVTSRLDAAQDSIVYEPQFPFGHGLSYTSFEYSDLRLSSDTLRPGETVTVSVDVVNTGSRESSHSVLLFASDQYASVVPRERQLKGMGRVQLAPGDSETVQFEIAPSDLSIIGRDMKPVTEPGAFQLTVGDQSATVEYVDEAP